MSIETIEKKLESVIASARAKVDTGTAAELRALNSSASALHTELSAAIAEGASLCPSCGNRPHGMRQEFTAGREVIHGFEIGCLKCRDHRAVGFDRDNAVKKWNSGPVPGGWRQPKDGSTLEVEEGAVVRVFGDPATGKMIRASCQVKAP
jgi:hypothetical protein